MNRTTILDYLASLEQNNNRRWFHDNKLQYQIANKEFEELIQNLIFEIGKTDSSILNNIPKELTFKLMRDTRFSKDKSPYNPTFRAHISSKGKLPIPVGYFLVIKPNNRSFLGGGLFADMFKDATTLIRDYIVAHADEWNSIISAPSFKSLFEVKGNSLKNIPNGYDSNCPQFEYLKYKSWYIEYPLTDEQVRDDNFIMFASQIFKEMQPFNAFLNNALEPFKMPTRP